MSVQKCTTLTAERQTCMVCELLHRKLGGGSGLIMQAAHAVGWHCCHALLLCDHKYHHGSVSSQAPHYSCPPSTPAVFGTTSSLSSITMRPRGLASPYLPRAMSKNTSGFACRYSRQQAAGCGCQMAVPGYPVDRSRGMPHGLSCVAQCNPFTVCRYRTLGCIHCQSCASTPPWSTMAYS